jgi:hypothetical protein
MRAFLPVFCAVAVLLASASLPLHCMGFYPSPQQCSPPGCYVTKMVPCVKTELVAQVCPTTVCVTVPKTGYTCRKVMLKGTPVGCPPGGSDPCTQCFPKPFCKVVTQKVPYTYYENVAMPSYNLVYRKVCRQVWRPQVYRLDAYPLCR